MRKCFIIVLLNLCGLAGFAANHNVLDFGAISNGKTLTTSHIQKAIDQCYSDGGGVVIVPEGQYLVGTLNLRDNVEFHFEPGAVLVASTNLADYQRHNSELAGVFYTEESDNVSITGHGTIYGRGMEFMYPDSAKVIAGPVLEATRQKEDFRKVKEGIGDGPLYPKDRYHQMIVFSNCTNVRLRDFTCIDSPYWCFLIVHCDHVWISGLHIDNNLLIPNSDGIDVISTSNVYISDCDISCGDDAIILAGYSWHFGDPGFKRILRPVRNINVANCNLRSRSSAIRIGGWDQNRMSNFNFSNINIYDSNRGINVNIRDSCGVENMNFTNISIDTRLHTGDWWGHGEPIMISTMLGTGASPGAIRNVNFTNIHTNSENSIYIYAGDGCTIENIRFTNFDFHLKQSLLDDVEGGNIDLRPSAFPDKDIFASDTPIFYVKNAEGITLSHGEMSWGSNIKSSYFTVPIEGEDVNGLTIDDVSISKSPVAKSNNLIKLTNCTNVKNGSENSR